MSMSRARRKGVGAPPQDKKLIKCPYPHCSYAAKSRAHLEIHFKCVPAVGTLPLLCGPVSRIAELDGGRYHHEDITLEELEQRQEQKRLDDEERM